MATDDPFSLPIPYLLPHPHPHPPGCSHMLLIPGRSCHLCNLTSSNTKDRTPLSAKVGLLRRQRANSPTRLMKKFFGTKGIKIISTQKLKIVFKKKIVKVISIAAMAQVLSCVAMPYFVNIAD